MRKLLKKRPFTANSQQWPVLALSFLLLAGCGSHAPGRAVNSTRSSYYFSLRDYFKLEATRMQHRPYVLLKTITLDKHTETKTLNTLNWAAELDFFSSSDINKPAWLGKYRCDSSAGMLTYTALDSSLKVRKIQIFRQPGLHPKVHRIAINLEVKNFLYTLDEQLVYIPDSLYSIERLQHIYLLGKKQYTITGKLSP